MKTLSLTVALLLLTVHCCTAMPRGVAEMTPGRCCFNFYTGRIRQSKIISIAKTHTKCREKGFVVSTSDGKDICVAKNLNWAQRLIKEQEVNQEN